MNPRADLELGYRPEIDGLRALAVLGAVLFHLDFSWATGGFVGVDVFLVISGYLITARLFPSMEAGTFCYGDFVRARLRRLYPASLATIAVSSAAALCLLPPDALVDFARTALSGVLASANLYFWRTLGYFDAHAEPKPLLHLWSLGVEEQFYAVWPFVLLFFAHRFGEDRRRLWALSILVLLGALLSEYLLVDYRRAAFFLSPLRAYEFAIGAAIYFARRHGVRASVRVASLGSVVGLATIVGTMCGFRPTMVFPGLPALLPCFGTALFLYFAAPGQWAYRALSATPATWIGRRSYSLYLAHWPIIVFAGALGFDLGSLPLRLSLILVSFGGAALLHVAVEQRFRYAPPGPGRSFFGWGCAGSSVALALGLGGILWWKGLPERYPEEFRHAMATPIADRGDIFGYREAPFGSGLRILVIGDSQASEVVRLLEAAGITRYATVSLAFVRSDCGVIDVSMDDGEAFFATSPRLRHDRHKRAQCRVQWDRLFASAELRDADRVIVASLWNELHLRYVPALLARLTRDGKRTVHVLGRKAFLLNGKQVLHRFSWRRRFMKSDGSASSLPAFAARYRSDAVEPVNATLRAMASAANVGFVDVMGALCPTPATCAVIAPNGDVLIRDPVHFTKAGLDFVSASVLRQLALTPQDSKATGSR